MRVFVHHLVPINMLFFKRIYLHTNDEKSRQEQIDKFITLNNLNKDMTKHKIRRISKYFLSNELDKLEIKGNSINHLNFSD